MQGMKAVKMDHLELPREVKKKEEPKDIKEASFINELVHELPTKVK